MTTQSAKTMRTYVSDWEHFAKWCASKTVPSLPASPQDVALYISDLARGCWNEECPRKASTISRRLASINAIHKEKGKLTLTSQRHPEISAALQGIKQMEGSAPKCKEPIDSETAMLAVGQSSSSVALVRNKVIFLLGLNGAFRRSELAGILLENISWRSGGLTITVPTSEIDSLGKGRDVEISSSSNPKTCPVTAVREWLQISGLDKVGNGPLLRHVYRNGQVGSSGLNPGSINYIVKKLLGNAGLEKEAYSAHSLRMGFIRGAVADDISDRKIMRQSGLKTHTMIDRYSGAVKLDRGTTDAVRGESERMPETKEPRVVEGKPPEAPSQEHQSSGEKQREIPRSEAEPAYAEGLEMEEASSLNNMSKFEAPQVEADRLPFELIPETKEPCEGQAKPPETPSQVHVSGREQQLAEWFEMEEASRSIKSKLEAPQIEADRLSPRRALKPITEEQIETLAVIALMQPITGAHIATVRGAESWTSIKCLAKRGLIAFIKINKVHHWQVTQSCLDRLNLVSVEDLFHEQIFEKTFPMLASNRG